MVSLWVWVFVCTLNCMKSTVTHVPCKKTCYATPAIRVAFVYPFIPHIRHCSSVLSASFCSLNVLPLFFVCELIYLFIYLFTYLGPSLPKMLRTSARLNLALILFNIKSNMDLSDFELRPNFCLSFFFHPSVLFFPFSFFLSCLSKLYSVIYLFI